MNEIEKEDLDVAVPGSSNELEAAVDVDAPVRRSQRKGIIWSYLWHVMHSWSDVIVIDLVYCWNAELKIYHM